MALSVDDSEAEKLAAKHDSLDDAVEVSSLRSLTKRSVSAARPSPSGLPDRRSGSNAPLEGNGSIDTNSVKSRSRRTSSHLSGRISNTSNLDNINLDDDIATAKQESSNSVEKVASAKTLSFSSITNALPSLPWSPPAEAASKGSSLAITTSLPSPPTAAPPPNTRKLTGPFSWLSRNSSAKDKEPPVPTLSSSPQRRDISSGLTVTSNPEMMLSRLQEEKEVEGHNANGANRETLKDRFKSLRMREEINKTPPDPKRKSEPSKTVEVESQNDETASAKSDTGDEDPSKSASAPPSASGSILPSAQPAEGYVDWDLWQSVVFEGPIAVARTSPEELNRAIATGIPNAIRGVIWQVLAQSKNDELERLYRQLLSDGRPLPHGRREESPSVASTQNESTAGAQNGRAVTPPASFAESEPPVTAGSSTANSEKGVDIGLKSPTPTPAERLENEKRDAASLHKLEKTIRRDLGARTSFSKYAAAAGLQEGLFSVCKAYALYDEEVGYPQGVNFLIMPLLFNMPEEEAFCLLARLMNQFHLRTLFIQDMPSLHLRLYQFERLLEDKEPALYCHLHRKGISPHLYATQWFLTLFAYRFPLQLVLRIYDLIFSEGLSAILRFGIVLMQKNASTLLGISDMQQLTTYLKDKLFDVYIDKDPCQGSILENGFFGSTSSSVDKEVYKADQMVRDACGVKITPEMLKVYTAEWEEKSRAEKSRESELQDLRMNCQNYALQVRKLEERVQVCDREQAALATELVHTKVENEELRDENESLKGQVRELKLVIQKQPMEIEEGWKLERDDLMKRNEKVHEENQRLEKDMAELEEELVQTKMHYAEINSQHETLTRKWSDLKRQFA